MGKKIFVGNLSFDTTSSQLESLFSEIGQCESAAVITDRATGRSRGFGFVEMASAADAQKAIETLNGRELEGRTINVSEAKERSSGGGGGGGDRGRGGFGGRRNYSCASGTSPRRTSGYSAISRAASPTASRPSSRSYPGRTRPTSVSSSRNAGGR